MRTRNTETPKLATTKKTPPTKKSAAKTTPKPTESGPESSTPKPAETKRASAIRAKQAKNNENTPTPNTSTDSKPEPAVEEAKASADAAQVTPKVVSGSKPVAKRTPGKSKTPTTAKSVSTQAPKSGEIVVVKVEESPKKEEVVGAKVVESTKEDCAVENVGESVKEKKTAIKEEEPPIANVGESEKLEGIVDAKVVKSPENEESNVANEVGEAMEEMKDNNDTKSVEVEEEPKSEPAIMEEDTNEDMVGEDAKPEEDEYQGDEAMEDFGDQEGHKEPGEEELAEDDAGEPAEEAETLEDEEHRELTAIAKERKIKKEHEIFVGGLDRDAVEEDVRKVFEKIGEIVEVRLHKNPLTNKNKGYAFVKFANKEHASRALSEMKKPLVWQIHGEQYWTAPSEDNDTLILGNICNTWTKRAIKQKLKAYGVECVENITLVPDGQHEGLSRGFAFLEFSCHADAMLAYKRLQKPDVVFGHLERTAKVAFAEPLRDPDPEIMAHCSMLPHHLDEDCVREQFKAYGEIERIMLARNMSNARRKGFGFVDFTTHEAAVACIDGINNKELGDRNSKMKVKARLSNPLPKTQAVKGGMCGGFRIGHGGGGGESFSKFGRGFGQGGHLFHKANFQQGRDLYQHGRGQSGRMGFGNEYDLDNPYPEFHGKRIFGQGGRTCSLRGAYHASGGGALAAGPSRPNLDRPRHVAIDRGRGKYISSSRQPFSPEGGFDRPFIGRHFDDPYLYDESAHGIKRHFYMMDQDPGYMEPSRLRPRLDYYDPAVSFHGTHYQDTFGAGSDLYSHDYYCSDPKLPREQRYIRFMNVKRKKDFICLERVNGKFKNILDGLELHMGVFSAAEQKRIVEYVYVLQEMGKTGQLKERTYSTPQKWMRGKGRVTIQFGCCYNYATDKYGNLASILQNEIVDPIPDLFKVIIRRLVRWHVLPPSCVPDSCIVNIYEEGDCIPPHIDNHDFVRPFCTVSFLSECDIIFGSNLKVVGPGEFDGPVAIPLPVGSVLVFNGNGADIAKHCVPAVPTKRISITFRKMDESKRPIRFVPEPDLQGLQPLSYEVDRSRRLNPSQHLTNRQAVRREGNTEEARGFVERRDIHSEPHYSTRTRHWPADRCRSG